MDYSYKQLTTANVVLVRELLKVFGEAFGEPETYRNTVPSNAYLESLLLKPYFIALAAMDREKVVGGLVAYELEKFEQERKEIFIYDLAVSEQYRRKGIATKLISELKHIAKNRKAYVIFVLADEADTPAIKLYESMGLKKPAFNFDISVDG